MENISLENLSLPILESFEKLGIPRDNLIILALIFLLILDNNSDFILILVLVLLLN